MIYLARDTEFVSLDVDSEAVCVRHRQYAPPQTGAGCQHMEWADFRERHMDAMRGKSTLVVVGLSRILTPSNRCAVGQVLLRPRPGVRNIVVDRTLFVADPWRMDWPFRCIGHPREDIDSSYLAESRWKGAQDGFCDDPFTIEQIARWGHGVVTSEYDRYFHLDIERVPVSEKVRGDYQTEKAAAFDEEHTAPAIISRLSAIAADALPTRSIPTPNRLFSSTHHSIVQTDLAVDDWLVGRLRYVADITNKIGQIFHESD